MNPRSLFMGRLTIVVMAAILSGATMGQVPGPGSAKSGENRPASRVEVVAFEEATGRLLAAPEVRIFESAEKQNLAPRFHSGVADNVAYGIYRIEAWVPGYLPELRYVLVNQPRVAIVLGMPVSPIENSPLPTIVGRVVRGVAPKKAFIKLVGVYNGQEMESAIGADGAFGFGAVRCCRYMFIVIANGGTVLSKEITISDATLEGKITVSFDTPPLDLEMRRAP